MSNEELIEKKIDGTLTAQERKQFDDLLRTDPAFAQAYTTQTEMVHILQQRCKADLHKQLEMGYSVYRRNQRSKKIYYSIAAVFLIIVAGGWFWWNSANKTLFDKYYRPYEALVYRGSSPAVSSQAVLYYEQAQYTKAIPLLKSLQQTDNKQEYWSLLLGNAYLQSDSIPQAINQFTRVAESSDSNYAQYGSWYAAMSYLKDNNVPRARESLQRIANQPGLFQRKANQLLNELK